MIPLVLYCPNDITLLAHKIHACIRWEHNLNSIHLLEVVNVLEKGLEQHTKKKIGGVPGGVLQTREIFRNRDHEKSLVRRCDA